MDLPFCREHHEDLRRFPDDAWCVLDYDELPMPVGHASAAPASGGKASMRFCEDAIAAAKAGLIDAIVTAPISKNSWQLAGYTSTPATPSCWPTSARPSHVAMMFVAPQLKVVLATIHEPLFEMRNKFTIGCVFKPIDLADQALREWFGIEHPRIAVCGLNPHAGEDGQFGDEEQRIIAPAILMASEAGINVTGPYPADTVFLRALDGRVRLRGGHVPRPGADPREAAGLRERGEPDARPADHPHQPRPRHGLRHRRQEQGRPLQHDRGHQPGHRPGPQTPGEKG